uniref:MRG domain-containing protein n=1 Tax=Angiostrongylus cantonensis TaxID=6313 RepID=A0A0K0DCX4_ANGCA
MALGGHRPEKVLFCHSLEKNSCHCSSSMEKEQVYDENILNKMPFFYDRQIKKDQIEDYKLLVEGLKTYAELLRFLNKKFIPHFHYHRVPREEKLAEHWSY